MIIKHTNLFFLFYICLPTIGKASLSNTSMPIIDSKNTPGNIHESKERMPSPNNQPDHKVESFSLMLSDTEQRVIEKAIKNDKNTPYSNGNSCYFLGGILYMSPKNWTLWLNEQHYSNETTIPGISILDVTRDSIELKENTSKSRTGVRLKINQTFCAHINYALAGDQRHTMP
jgi:hypothetical protein